MSHFSYLLLPSHSQERSVESALTQRLIAACERMHGADPQRSADFGRIVVSAAGVVWGSCARRKVLLSPHLSPHPTRAPPPLYPTPEPPPL